MIYNWIFPGMLYFSNNLIYVIVTIYKLSGYNYEQRETGMSNSHSNGNISGGM